MDIALVTAEQAWEADDDAALLVEALARLGVSAAPARWDDASVDWAGFAMAVLKSPWDYSDRHDEFIAWAEATAAIVPVFNPIEVVRWNCDKRYLEELSVMGLPVVPTRYISPKDLAPAGAVTAAGESAETASAEGERVWIGEALRSQFPHDGGSSSIVVKPTVSAGSKDTARYAVAQLPAAVDHTLDLLRAGREVMVQPYLDSVEQAGETGLIFFNGEFSHAFRKGPLLSEGQSNVEGLFAVENISPRVPSLAERSLAERTVTAIAARFPNCGLLYTRVDLLLGEDGEPFLLELEMVEPSYFLTTDPGAAQRAAAAYKAALDKVRGG